MNAQAASDALNVAQARLDSRDYEGAVRFARKSKQLDSSVEADADKILAFVEKFGPDSDFARHVRDVMDARDHYQMFGMTRYSFDVSTIEKIKRKLSVKLHPDKNHAHGADEAFKLLMHAHSVLTDSDQRAKYDWELQCRPPAAHAGHQAARPSPAQPSPAQPSPRPAPKAAAPPPPSAPAAAEPRAEVAKLIEKLKATDLKEVCRRLRVSTSGKKERGSIEPLH